MVKYAELNCLIEKDSEVEILMKVSVNKKLRYLNGNKWVVNKALNALKNVENWLIDNSCIDI
jgi:hypothetical protein